MTQRVAWVMNLDVEFEFIDPSRHQPSRRLQAEVRSRTEQILDEVRRFEAVEVVLLTREERVDASRGACWCPTPRALRLLEAAGVPSPDAPPFEVLQRVNHRSFTATVTQGLPGSAFLMTADEVFGILESAPDCRWLLKRPFGFAGRMRKVVDPREMVAADRVWIEASMRAYGRGLQVEPMVDVVRDYAWHGLIEGDAVRRGAPVVLQNVDGGAWGGHRLARSGELDPNHLTALRDTFDAVAESLREAGYFGPFGIDAFVWVDASGREHLQPLSEVNARYSMAWWCGMLPPP